MEQGRVDEHGDADGREVSAVPEASTDLSDAPPAVRQLSERVEARLAELDNAPVSAHGDVYAAIHAELSQALERLDA